MLIPWSSFKSFQTARKTDILMVEDANYYYLHTGEDTFSINCNIDKNASDTTELLEFEADYLSLCNPKKIVNVTVSSIPSNDTEMKPYGIRHDHFDASSGHIFDITLSNKSGKDFTYTCSTIPEEYDSVVTLNTNLIDEIEECNAINGTIETFMGYLPNGEHKLLKPFILDFKFPDFIPAYKLWGCYLDAKDFGEDDFACFQIVDRDNVLGYGAGLVLKEYDEMFIRTIAKSTGPLVPPTKDFGDILAGLVGRLLYYATDPTKTDIKIWKDCQITD